MENEAFPENNELALIGASAKSSWDSSKNWAQSSELQGGLLSSLTAGIFTEYFGANDDYSWERAIYEYAWEDKNRGLLALGHVLHLLEDATVPDHTRNDPHPPILDMGSPYEGWTKKFDRNSIKINVSQQPILSTTISNYFDKLATFSNNNFLSRDTILSENYSSPKIIEKQVEKLGDGQSYLFGYGKDENGEKIRLVLIKENAWTEPEYSLRDNDDLILTDYWTRLSEQAILHGAGVIKLFFDEVEKEKQTKVLYEKNRSWWMKQMDKFKSSVFSLASVFYGVSVTQKDLEENVEVSPPLGGETSETPEPEVRPQTAPQTQLVPTELTPATQPQTAAIFAIVRPAISSPAPSFAAVAVPVSQNTSSIVPFMGSSGNPQRESENVAPPSPSVAPAEEGPPPKPTISLVISECNQSLSSDGCVVATTTLNLEWETDLNPAELDHFSISCSSNSSPCPVFNFSVTSATSTAYVPPENNTTLTFNAKTVAKNGQESDPIIKTVEISTTPVVINEIAWAGTGSNATTSKDEWIELKNITSQPLDLSQFKLKSLTDEKPTIQLEGVISANGFFLIERTDDTTVSDIPAGQTASFGGGTGSGLSNSGEVLAIEYKGAVIDRTPEVSACSGWCGGFSDSGNPTMERYDPNADGSDKTNWSTFAGFLPNGKNAEGENIKGTPSQRNSINYFIDKTGSTLSQNKTLKKSQSPYLVINQFGIPAGKTLTLEPGVIIKLWGGASMKINGVLKSQGSAENPVVFTSFQDDDCGIVGGCEDTNATTTAPAPGDWASIAIAADGSEIEHTIIRYGGLEDPSDQHWANLRVENTSLVLKNSIIEYARAYGIWMKNSGGTFESNIFRYNNHSVPGQTQGIGIVISGGAPNITNNQFVNNYHGIQIESNGAPTISNNTFTQNLGYAMRSGNSYPTFSGNTVSGQGINGIGLQGALAQDYTLTPDLPYVIQNTSYVVSEGKTLNIAPGTVIKLQGVGSISVAGKLSALGTPEQKIIFTSLNDDAFGGDTNGTTTAPATGDWHNISFVSSSDFSNLNHIVLRYGGAQNPTTEIGALRVKDTSLTLDNSTVEKNYSAGIWLENSASTTIANSLIQDHQEPNVPSPNEPSYGIFLSNSVPLIQNTTFKNNKINISSDTWIDGGENGFE